MLATELLEPKGRAFLVASMGIAGTAADIPVTDAAMAASGLQELEPALWRGCVEGATTAAG